MTRFAIAAAAVAAVVVGGSYVLRPARQDAGDAGRSEAPSISASPVASPAGSTSTMTESFTSQLYGYSFRYPAGWSSTPATALWSPPAWKAANSPQEPFDFVQAPEGPSLFRSASALLPNGAVVDDWINEFVTFSDDPACAPPRDTLEEVLIAGRPGRLRGFCGAGWYEIEATVVVDRRVYVFTLFLGPDAAANEAAGRALFDAFAATIQLHP